MNNRQKTYRLFFALWPSDQIRQSIVEVLSGLPPKSKGRVITPHNLHATLHFVGQVTEFTKDCMHVAAQSVNAEAFQLDLDCFGHFPKAKIFWMGAKNAPEKLAQLHKKLGIAIEGCGFVSDKRAYTPHVTLMRKCVHSALKYEDFSIPWTVDEFVLVESVQDEAGVNYRVLERYSLL